MLSQYLVIIIISSLCYFEIGYLILYYCQVLIFLVRFYIDNIIVLFIVQQFEDYVVIYCGEVMDQLLYRNIIRTGFLVILLFSGIVFFSVNGFLIEGDFRESQIIFDMSEFFEFVVYSNKFFDLLNIVLNFCIVCIQY